MTRHRREWDGVGNWSSHPCKSPAQAVHDSATEMLCALKWDAAAAEAFRKALRSWERAGRPGMPLGASDFKSRWRRMTPAERKTYLP